MPEVVDMEFLDPCTLQRSLNRNRGVSSCFTFFVREYVFGTIHILMALFEDVEYTVCHEYDRFDSDLWAPQVDLFLLKINLSREFR